jgi:hypothetical protein
MRSLGLPYDESPTFIARSLSTTSSLSSLRWQGKPAALAKANFVTAGFLVIFNADGGASSKCGPRPRAAAQRKR